VAITTVEELEEFIAWVEEDYGPEVAAAYRERAVAALEEGTIFPHVLLDEVRKKFEDSDTRSARSGGLMRFCS